MVYVVSYHLANFTLRDPNPFYAELFSSRNWWRYLDETFLISTPETPQQLDARLRKYLHEKDGLLIIRAAPEYAGWLPKEAWDWIKQREAAGEFAG